MQHKIHSTGPTKKIHREMRDVLTELGAEDVTVEQGRVHLKFHYMFQGKKLMVVMSGTPTTHRWRDYLRSNHRRALAAAENGLPKR